MMQTVISSSTRGGVGLEGSLGLLLRNLQCRLCEGRSAPEKCLAFFRGSAGRMFREDRCSMYGTYYRKASSHSNTF